MLNNFSVAKKIAVGYAVVIGLLIVVTGVGWFGLDTAGDGFQTYREIARDNVLLGRLQANLIEARLQVKSFIQTGDEAAYEKFNARFRAVGEFITEAEKQIQNPTRAALIQEIKNDYAIYNDNVEKVVAARRERNQAVIGTMNPVGQSMRERLTKIMTSAYRDRDSEAAYLTGRMQETLLLGRLYAAKFLETNDEADLARAKKELEENMAAQASDLDQAIDNPGRRALLEQFTVEHRKYVEALNKAVSIIKARNAVISDKLDVIGPKIADAAEKVKRSIKEEQDTLGPAVQAGNGRTLTITLVVSALGIILSLFFGVLIAKRITHPIVALKDAAAEIAKGDLDQTIQLDQHDEVGQLADAFKEMVRNLKEKETAGNENKRMVDGVIAQVTETAHKLQQGNLSSRARNDNATGAYREMLEGFNSALEAVIGPLNVSADCLKRISRGDIPPKLTDQYQGDFRDIADSLNRCIDALSSLIVEMSHMSAEHDRGDIDVAIPSQKFEGAFREMADGVNRMVSGHIAVKKKAMACIKAFGNGNFDAPLEKFPGKKAFINDTIEGVRGNLKNLSNELCALIDAAKQGRLGERGDAAKFAGGWAALVVGVNEIISAIMDPINEAGAVLDQLADCDLRARVLGNFKGDHARIKASINKTAEALHNAVAQVSESVEQVSAAAQQIASSSQQVAEGASEQASALEETSSSLEEMSSMTKQNADNTQQAKGLAEETRLTANKGSTAMDKMMDAMGKIKSAAEGTAEIIKDINDIAFQTNLLALNAAVEAARAGEAGRGFAVVAEEVRNLAGRAKDAAKNTETLIKESVNLADQGQAISGEVAGNLTEIVTSVGKVTELVTEINVASQEQARGIEQVNRAVSEMDRVVQQAAANSEESSSAAEELAAQSSELTVMVQQFNLENRTASGLARTVASAPKKTEKSKPKRVNNKPEFHIDPESLIPLEDDADFAEF